MAPMPEAVLHPAVAATDQRIYMFGGEDAMQNPVRIIQVKYDVLLIFHPCIHLNSALSVHQSTQSLAFI